MDKTKQLSAIAGACAACTKCELSQNRTNSVFSAGSATAEIAVIGEAPGRNEDLRGTPFIGRSGALLDEMLAAARFSRTENLYITNIVKCRPPDNRDPKPAERAACVPYLHAQLDVLQPKIVVCVGRIAAQFLIRKDFSVTREHGLFIEKNGILYMGTFHPAALMRTPSNKPLAAADFALLREKALELGILR